MAKGAHTIVHNQMLEQLKERDEEQKARIQQLEGALEEALEELRSSFESRMKRAARLVDEGELNDYWRGNRAALEVCLHKLAALSGEAPGKEE